MQLTYDYHTHTIYSHGKGTIEDNIKVALEKGLESVAITDHGPGHVTYGVRRKKISQMRLEIERLQKKYPQIHIKLGVEANIIRSDGKLDITEEDKKAFDIVLAGYHYGVFEKNFFKTGILHLANFVTTRLRRKSNIIKLLNTKIITNAIYQNDIYILTHPGSKGFVDMREIAKACAKTGTLMEINNSHGHLTVEEIKEAAKEDVSFIIGSDAHQPEHVGEYKAGLERALEAGLSLDRIVNIRNH